METPLVVLIAASSQPALLRRTLESLAWCEKPNGFREVVVVENGCRSGLDEVVAEFAPRGAFRYLFSAPANKSLALNRALAQVGDALVLFTDDDVRVAPQTLTAYARASEGRRAGQFYGGPIVADYEAGPPDAWLARFLPRSAAGWKLPVSERHEIRQPEFIGPNLCAFAADVVRVGGFDERLGPGCHMPSPGEDTDIQQRLLAHGIRGYYLPEAVVHHFVRSANVMPQFALERAERNGIYWGIRQANQRGFFPRGWFKAYGQWLNDRWRMVRWRRSGEAVAGFRAEFVAARWRGRWRGIRLRREQLAPA